MWQTRCLNVRKCGLMAVSPVLGHLLSECNEDNPELDWTDFEPSVVSSFFFFALHCDYNFPCNTEDSHLFVKPCDRVERYVKMMPIIHKFDCRALLANAHRHVETKGSLELFYEIIKYYNHDTEFVTDNVIETLCVHLSGLNDTKSEELLNKITLFSPAVVAKMAFYLARAEHASDSLGNKVVAFRATKKRKREKMLCCDDGSLSDDELAHFD